ncbi:stAR-related lipid transfer protein 13-like isoform X2 [Carassius auratus]|uniref:StAR-related lipid transfer protein 13-like isoform X2 n=1 Tax=Carassius auratus TaxID=7957 RepID=A0A6P6K7C7_CARAU|nr:stAR-related lipid transfer protein 13-like isoform X2 [Carassius auratus]
MGAFSSVFLFCFRVFSALNASQSNSGLFCSCSRDYPGLLQITLTRSAPSVCGLELRRKLEAKEACEWLRAAGFPQYAQLYEASLFPIEISAVRRDHEFLDQDSLKALCRRLATLNKCAAMSLEVHFLCKQSEDSEEDDSCALSSRWAFQRESKTWSRLRSLSPAPAANRASTLRPSGSSDSVLSDNSLLDVTSLTSDLSASSLSLDSARETTFPKVAAFSEVTMGEGASLVCVSAGQDENDDTGSSSSLPSVREKPKRPSRSLLWRKESIKKQEMVPRIISTVNQHQPPSDLHCTSDSSLPGQITNKCRIAKDVTWRSHTKCHSKVSPKATRNKPHRACLYLEDYQLAWEIPKLTNQNNCLRKEDHVVHLPFDHKPGTFPKSLSIESLCPLSVSQSHDHIDWAGEYGDLSLDGSISRSGSQDFLSGFGRRRNSLSSVGSIYDNISETPGSPCDIFDPGKEKAFQHLDDILQHVHGLQHNIDEWSRSLGIQSQDQSNVETESTADTTLPSSLNYDEQSMSDVGTTVSDYDSPGNSVNEGEGEMRERRDSGVGASLTRPSRKLRWHSFQNSHRPSVTSASLEINRQSAAQLNLLQKFSLLRLTAILEKHTDTTKHSWSWVVSKFMKRSKVPDYKDKHVFGVPPIVNVQRTGQPLPQSIQEAMRYLRSQCLEKVGIFRKSGVKSRIQALRQLNENSPDHVTYQGQSAYDVADLIKQYFRDLPEPVLTSKLTDTFLHVYQFVPAEQRLQAVQAAVILLPDENREVLQTLLYFLSDIASAQENQMTADSLAVCLAPSILHLNASKKDGASPRLISRKGGAKPDHKDLSENMAATHCLSHMITECKKLFQIPHEMMLQSRNSYVAADAQPLPLHGVGVNALGKPVDYRAYLEDNIQCLLREASERSKGWHHAHGPENTELTYKKVGDGHPMRLWRVSVEIEAPPAVVLQRVLRERHLWDEDLLHSRVIEPLENNTEVFHYITDSMAPHPRRNFVVLRRWCDLPKGVCVLVSSSVEHDNVQLEAGLRAVLLTSRIFIEPCGMGRSRLTHYCRADLRGRSPDWYNKVFGHLCAMEVARIRSSFPVLSPQGPETKL